MFACCLLHQVEFSPVKAHTYMEHSNSITTLRFFFYAQVIGPDSADLPPASASRALARKGCVLIAERTDHFGVRIPHGEWSAADRQLLDASGRRAAAA
jgi:hypothetical protein